MVYLPCYSENGRKLPVWEPWLSISDYLDQIYFPQHPQTHAIAFEKGGLRSDLARELRQVHSFWVPRLKTNRHAYAFYNGVMLIGHAPAQFRDAEHQPEVGDEEEEEEEAEDEEAAGYGDGGASRPDTAAPAGIRGGGAEATAAAAAAAASSEAGEGALPPRLEVVARLECEWVQDEKDVKPAPEVVFSEWADVSSMHNVEQLCCYKYFKRVKVDIDVVRAEMAAERVRIEAEGIDDPALAFVGILIPELHDIMEAQGYTRRESKAYFMAAIGRSMFPANSMGEEWQVGTFFTGKAGTGKSTVTRIIEELHHKSDVGVLGNNSEENYPLESVAGKLVVVVPDSDASFNLQQGNFKIMVEGREVPVNRKYNSVLVEPWLSNFYMACNNFPRRWHNTEDDLVRRMWILPFPNFVDRRRDDLFSSLQKRIGRIIAACSLAYFWLIGRMREMGSTPAAWIPEEIEGAVTMYKNQLDPVGRFVRQYYEVGDGLSTGYQQFYEHFMKAARDWGRGDSVSMSWENVGDLLRKFGVTKDSTSSRRVLLRIAPRSN